MIYLPAEEIRQNVLQGLLKSTPQYGLDELEQTLADGKHKVFRMADAYVMVSVLVYGSRRVLSLDGFWVDRFGGWKFRSFGALLKMLAEAWDCQAVETGVSDARLLKGLLMIGCRVDSVIVKLEL